MEELNKKLAERVGIKPEIFYSIEPQFEQTRDSVSVYNKSRKIKEYLNFTVSLDLCFKYLVPKLFAYSIHTIWRTNDLVSELSMAEVWANTRTSYKAEAKTPALALCKAIEKLIDEEAK